MQKTPEHARQGDVQGAPDLYAGEVLGKPRQGRDGGEFCGHGMWDGDMGQSWPDLGVYQWMSWVTGGRQDRRGRRCGRGLISAPGCTWSSC